MQRRCVWAVGRLSVAACLACVAAAVDRQARQSCLAWRCELALTRQRLQGSIYSGEILRSSEFGTKFLKKIGLPLLLEVPKQPYNTLHD